MHRLCPMLVLLLSCHVDKAVSETGDAPIVDDTDGELDPDADADGFAESEDCDDSNPDVNPDAAELCDELDNDCDDEVDEADAVDAMTWYFDGDGDGYGDEADALTQCEAPSGYVSESKAGFDCDDTDADYHPGADESDCADPSDYNCDGSVAYEDYDEDGWAACEECDDANAEVHPEASEICDEIDNDCDELTDDEDDSLDSETATDWYLDADEDGYGNEEETLLLCEAPSGYVEESTEGFDCDDADADYHPGADESDCSDSSDYNCDGSVAYEDVDGDGWAACEECDDSDPGIHPDATEICNEIDDDCDGDIDDDDSSVTDTTSWYIDVDGDGFGSEDYSLSTCEMPSGYVDDATDCDDGDAEVSPDGSEICNEIDDDCDGDIDDEDDSLDSSTATTWYADADSDGYGDADTTTLSCEAASGTTEDATDCDDTNAEVSPAAVEICNEIDDDCDGDIDDDDTDVTGTEIFYIDYDGDGYGSEDYSSSACEAPSGWVDDSTDCDDTDASVSPAGSEICNEVDDDCDGDIDDDDSDVTGTETWYADSDGDGFGADDSTTEACEMPSGTTDDSTDCDDSNAEVSPDGTEICNEIDDDCDGDIDDDDATVSGSSTWYIDHDGDGYGSDDYTDSACQAPSGWVDDSTDCDDTDSSVSPAASEICNEIDDDCDGEIDDDDASVSGTSTWYADADSDGYGDADSTTEACEVPSGYGSDATDCDDASAAVSPDAIEICDEIDNDCDGTVDNDDASDVVTWYADADSDGYGDADSSTVSCEELSGYTLDASDCDDSDSTIHPDVEEGCPDEVDNDCDGTVDEADTDTVTVVVEGVDSDLNVCVPCSSGDFSCQAQNLCDELTGETCEYQTYDCVYGTQGSWYPPTYGGGSNFNFAYSYDLVSIGTIFGNICDGSGVANSFGIATNYSSGLTGYWRRK